MLKEEDVEVVIANYERATLSHYVFDKKDGKYGKSGTYVSQNMTKGS